MTTPDTNTPDPTSDDEELPDHQCAEVADETGERCRNAAIPGLDRCHAHVDDYADLAEALGSGPMTATAPEDGSGSPPLRHENPGSDREKAHTPTGGTGAQFTETVKTGGSAVQKMENASK